MKVTRLLITPICLILIFGCINSLRADISGAHNVVLATINQLYSDVSVDYDNDEALLASVEQSVERHLTPVLDFEKFTKLILAKHWKTASDNQRARFASILKGFLFRTLTKAIAEHHQTLVSYQEHIKVMDARPGRNEDRAIVSVVIETSDGQTVNIDFRMGRNNGRWQAYDVIVQEISFAINYRAILNSEIKKHGIEKVAETFDSKLRF